MKIKKPMGIISIIFLALILLYAFFWFFSFEKYDIEYGISFNQNHAVDLGLDWKQAYDEILKELKPGYMRVAAMWSEVEPEKDKYDFEDVDYMMDKAALSGAKVILVVGQKAPRWPECHVPNWIKNDPENSRERLLNYVRKVVERYKDNEALELWQVENEPFINFKFGGCEDYDKDAVYGEIELVRGLDQGHKIIITDSGELSTWIKASRAGDIFGTTMYRIVRMPGGMRFSYDWLPAGFYRLKAALFGRGGNDFFVSELQAEPWFTDSTPLNTAIEEQEETMNPERLLKHFVYVERVNASRAYLWGVEWWYFMKKTNNDSRYWDIVKTKMAVNDIEAGDVLK